MIAHAQRHSVAPRLAVDDGHERLVATVEPLHHRQACARYVDLRLGIIDGVEHTIDNAIHLVAKSHGAVAARYAASVCDNRPVEQVIEARKARPDDFRKPRARR